MSYEFLYIAAAAALIIYLAYKKYNKSKASVSGGNGNPGRQTEVRHHDAHKKHSGSAHLKTSVDHAKTISTTPEAEQEMPSTDGIVVDMEIVERDEKDRRKGDRRKSNIPIDFPGRRKSERRSGKDRRDPRNGQDGFNAFSDKMSKISIEKMTEKGD